ncbi:hypothetical protein V7O66_03160 [Methanolobus sp. ZRKC3]|uniref:hypothetical protein n=1 Tax=Methanolobus sp. ZRKC3 TaxID=3125786 RepID=UPI00324B28A6
MNADWMSILFILLVGIAIGSGASTLLADDYFPTELQLVEGTSSIGSVDNNNTDQQLYSYSFTLLRKGEGDCSINSIKPVFTEGFSGRILMEESNFVVNEMDDSGILITLTGKVEFDATGLSKKEIMDFDPFISYISVSSKEVLDFSLLLDD